MSLGKKYSGLPDLDASQEIYETPALTDDASTIQTDTLRTESPTPSEDGGDERLIRDRIDQNNARRRFEPTLISARDVNFSDTVSAGERKSYRTKSRRRRRRDYNAGSGSESDEETLTEKISRLKREAEEVRLMLEQKHSEFSDSVEEQPSANKQASGKDEGREVDQLHALIAGLDAPSQSYPNSRSEETLLRSLSAAQSTTATANQATTRLASDAQPSTTAALAAVADRMTALETALGLPSVSTSSPSILPTLDHLSAQLNTLTNTLVPTSRSSTAPQPPAASPNLDDLQTRVRALTIEADKLTASRKAAMSSLSDLHEARLRYNQARHISRDRPQSDTGPTATSLDNQEAAIHSDLFLSEQASKITALYQLLPSITESQPLLPVVLDRLRSLSVIHAGAAEARGELDEVMRRQGETRAEVKRWREAVEETERRIEELKSDMTENVKVVGGMVRGIEERVKGLGKD